MGLLDLITKVKTVKDKDGKDKEVQYIPLERYIKTAAQARTEALRDRAKRGLTAKKKIRRRPSPRRYVKTANGRYEHRVTNNHSAGESKARLKMADKSKRPVNDRRRSKLRHAKKQLAKGYK